MSGGSLDYLAYDIERKLFDYKADIHYSNINGEPEVKIARKLNPMHDRELSEMMYDIACLLHGLEWSDSGDIGEDAYKEYKKKFKDKWFKRTDKDRIEAYKHDLQSYYYGLLGELSDG